MDVKEVFLRERRGFTLEDMDHIGSLDTKLVWTVIWCPTCGYDNCVPECHISDGGKLHFRLLEREMDD